MYERKDIPSMNEDSTSDWARASTKTCEASCEERRAWDRFMAKAWPRAFRRAEMETHDLETAIIVAGQYAGLRADCMMAERLKRFGAK